MPSDTEKYLARRSAVSAVTARFPSTISLMRRGGTPIARARAFWLSPRGLRKSSRRISPGCGFGIRPGFGRLRVVVDDFDICGSCLIQQSQLAQCRGLHVCRQVGRISTFPDQLRGSSAKAVYHAAVPVITSDVIERKCVASLALLAAPCCQSSTAGRRTPSLLVMALRSNAHNGDRQREAQTLRISSLWLLRRQRLQLTVELHVGALESSEPVIPGIAHAYEVAIV